MESIELLALPDPDAEAFTLSSAEMGSGLEIRGNLCLLHKLIIGESSPFGYTKQAHFSTDATFASCFPLPVASEAHF